MNSVVLSLLSGLALTLAVELLLALLLGVRGGKNLLVIALVNILTNPLVSYAAYWAMALLPPHSPSIALIIAALEVAAVLAEFLLYRVLLTDVRIGRLKLSLLLNAASFLAGVALTLLKTVL